MSLEEKIKKLKDNLLKRSIEAAENYKTQELIALSKKIEMLDILELKFSDISNSFHSIESEFDINKEQKNLLNFNSKSAKAVGKSRREELVRYLLQLNINIVNRKGVRYEIKNRLIGIATASSIFSNKWFLGLPDDNYEIVILICEVDKNKNINFILTNEVLKKIKGRLSTDSLGKQLKFNVKKEGSSYFLVIPNHSDIKIDFYIDNFELLKSI